MQRSHGTRRRLLTRAGVVLWHLLVFAAAVVVCHATSGERSWTTLARPAVWLGFLVALGLAFGLAADHARSTREVVMAFVIVVLLWLLVGTVAW